MVDAKTSASIAADTNVRGRHERAPNINCILHKRTRRHLDRVRSESIFTKQGSSQDFVKGGRQSTLKRGEGGEGRGERGLRRGGGGGRGKGEGGGGGRDGRDEGGVGGGGGGGLV